MTQNNLGSALAELGEQDERPPPGLEEAIAAYRAALTECTRESVPLLWHDPNNLGAALSRLGERESGTVRLKEAVVAYRAALIERTPQSAFSAPHWAMTQSNLGKALCELGGRERDSARLEEAICRPFARPSRKEPAIACRLDWAHD